MSTRRTRRLTDVELARLCRDELTKAEGFESGEADAARRKALNYYYGRPRSDDRAGHSRLQSLDLHDMVEAQVAQMMPGFEVDHTAKFVPKGEQDEEQAELESQAVEDVVWQDNAGFVEIVTAVKDALLMRLSVFHAAFEVDRDTVTHTYRALSEEAMIVAMQPQGPTETVEVVDQEEVIRHEDGPRYDVTVKRTYTHERLNVRAVAPEDFRYAADWTRPTLEGIRFCAHRETPTRGELVERGHSKAKVRELPAFDGDTGQTHQARSQSRTVPPAGGDEWSQECVEVWVCHMVVDVDGDGIGELWRLEYAGNGILEKEEAPFQPYALGVTTVRPHRPDGISDADVLSEIQDMRTHGLREWADNLREANIPRYGAVENQVNLVALADGLPVVPLKDANALTRIETRDIGPSAQAFLEYGATMRSERGGASLDLQSAEAQIAGHTAHGTERQYSAREMLAGLKARTFAETAIRGLWMLVHRTMRTHMRGTVELKRAGEWQRTDPKEWLERSRLKVNTGLTPAERVQRVQALQQVVMTQREAMSAGLNGILTDATKVHAAVTDYCKAAGLAAPDSYWIDPASPEAQQAAQSQAQQAQQERAMAQAREDGILQATWALERYKTDAELKYKYLDSLLDAEIEEAKLTGQATLQLQLEQVRMRVAANQQAARTTASAAGSMPEPEPAVQSGRLEPAPGVMAGPGGVQ